MPAALSCVGAGAGAVGLGAGVERRKALGLGTFAALKIFSGVGWSGREALD
jgi:hypothetical protein